MVAAFGALHLVHRCIGIRENGVPGICVLREFGISEACADVQVTVIDRYAVEYDLLVLPDSINDFFVRLIIPYEKNEFVAAYARDKVERSGAAVICYCLPALSYLAEHMVSGIEAQCVIYALEFVDVN